ATPEEEQKQGGSTLQKKSPPATSEYSEFTADDLKGMLTDAISREDYEQAAAIRDEMARRKEKE
ncbi:MAG: UvrB/UvrC motif-containing protein, partial [Bacteroidales bacterium]